MSLEKNICSDKSEEGKILRNLKSMFEGGWNGADFVGAKVGSGNVNPFFLGQMLVFAQDDNRVVYTYDGQCRDESFSRKQVVSDFFEKNSHAKYDSVKSIILGYNHQKEIEKIEDKDFIDVVINAYAEQASVEKEDVEKLKCELDEISKAKINEENSKEELSEDFISKIEFIVDSVENAVSSLVSGMCNKSGTSAGSEFEEKQRQKLPLKRTRSRSLNSFIGGHR